MSDLSKNILLFLVGIGVAVLLLEGFLRIYNPFPFRIRSNRIILPVNQESVFTDDTDTVIVRSNTLGFRGADPPEDLDEYVSLIAVGGSTTYCRRLSETDTWSHLLGDKLQGQNDKIWINNAGLPGHSTFGHKLLIEEYILKLKPTCVLLLVGINDVGRYDIHEFDLSTTKSYSTNFVMNILEKSEIFYTVKNMGRVMMARKFQLQQSHFDLASMEKANNTEEEIEKLVAHHQQYISAFSNRLEAIVLMCAKHHIKTVLITQPLLYGDTVDPYTNIYLGNLRIFSAGRENERLTSFMIDNKSINVSSLAYWELVQEYNKATLAIGAKTKVHVVDLAGSLSKNSTYFIDAIHFSKEGAKMVAEIIAEDISGHIDNSSDLP